MHKKNVTYFIIFASVVLINSYSISQKITIVKTIDGVPHIYNTNKGIKPDLKIEFEKELELGVEEGDNNYIFEQISGIDVDKVGNIYVLDYKGLNVKIFSKNGKYLKTIGRSGEGPGEFKNPTALSLNNNNFLIVGESMPPKLSIFDLNGNYIRNIMLNYLGMITGIKSINENNILLQKIMTELIIDKSMILMSYVLSVIDLSGKNINDIFIKKTERSIEMIKNISEREAYSFSWCIGSQEKIYIVEDIYNYEIKVYDKKGNLSRVIYKKFDPIKRTKEDFNRLQNGMNEYKKKFGFAVDIKFSDIKPIINSIFIDEKNRLWIDTPIEASKDTKTFNIFDEEGMYITKATIEIKGNGTCMIKNNNLYFVYQESDNVPKIYSFKILD